MIRKGYRQLFLGLTAAAIVVTIALVSVDLGAQQAPQQPGQQGQPGLRVGTYQPEMVFNQYPGRQQLVDQIEGYQQQMVEAQQQGDQEALMRIQMEAQQAQEQAIQQFQQDISQAVAPVAEEAGVEIVAVEVVYTTPNVEVTDLTGQVIQQLQAAAPEPQPAAPQQPAFPGFGQ